MIVYKLRAVDGTYVGKRRVGFGPPENARQWKNKGHLKNYLNYGRRFGGKVIVVEQCEIIETPLTYTPIAEFVCEVERKQQARKDQRDQVRKAAETTQRRKMFDELKKEFDNQ